MLLYWIWLSRCKGLSLNKRLELAARWGDPKTVYEQADVADKDLAPAQKILDDCERLGVQVLTIGDGAYPQRLKAIAEPPMVLYYKGVLPDFDREVAIGVVGTRRASAYGLLSAEKLARQMAERGGLVVSGMAAGIDAQAGWGALRAGKPTVAVLGGGVDVIYPTANRELYRELTKKYPELDIVASGGVSTLEDVQALAAMDIHGAIIGKAYYIGAINLKEAIEVAL